jgi:hypothetical protein
MQNSLSGFSWREREQLAFKPKPSPSDVSGMCMAYLPTARLRAIRTIHQVLCSASRVTASV